MLLPSYLRDLCCPVSVLASCRVLCSAIRATLLQRQICQSPGLALTAHYKGNEWGKIPVLTGHSSPFHSLGFRLSSPIFFPLPFSSPSLRTSAAVSYVELLSVQS